MNHSSAHTQKPAGFTVIEVLFAVMILGITVASIFGAQFAAVDSAVFARYTSSAIQLARCRMSEVELEIIVDNGFQQGDIIDSGDCCEFVEGEPGIGEFTCRTEIKMIDMPDTVGGLTGEIGEGDLTGGGMGEGLGAMTGMMGGDAGSADMGMGMANSIMPMVSNLLREAVRRVTVTVEWDQGSRHREYEISQYLVHPTQGPLQMMHQGAGMMDMLNQLGGGSGGSGSGGSGSGGSGSGGGSSGGGGPMPFSPQSPGGSFPGGLP